MRTERPSAGRGGPSLLRTERPRVCAWPHTQGDQRLVAAEVPPLSPVLRRARQASDLCDSGWKSHPRISKSARTSATTLCRGSHGNVSPQPASLQRWRPLEGPAAGGRRAPCTQCRHRAANGPREGLHAAGGAHWAGGAQAWGAAGSGEVAPSMPGHSRATRADEACSWARPDYAGYPRTTCNGHRNDRHRGRLWPSSPSLKTI